MEYDGDDDGDDGVRWSHVGSPLRDQRTITRPGIRPTNNRPVGHQGTSAPSRLGSLMSTLLGDALRLDLAKKTKKKCHVPRRRTLRLRQGAEV